MIIRDLSFKLKDVLIKINLKKYIVAHDHNVKKMKKKKENRT